MCWNFEMWLGFRRGETEKKKMGRQKCKLVGSDDWWKSRKASSQSLIFNSSIIYLFNYFNFCFALDFCKHGVGLEWNIYIYKEAFACFINKFNQGKARLIESIYI